VTLKVCVVAGERYRTVTPRYPIRSAPYGLPSTRSVYPTWLTLSTDCVHETEMRVGHTPLAVIVGAVGGVVSGGVVWVTTLLVPERLPAASTA
jgi:hypothetical protein